MTTLLTFYNEIVIKVRLAGFETKFVGRKMTSGTKVTECANGDFMPKISKP